MPKLALFAPCEKLIIDEGDESISLITVLQSLDVHTTENKPISPDAVVNKEWDAVALWYINDESDLGKTFKQRLDFVRPDGKIQLQSIIEFKMTKPWHRNKTHVTGMPIGMRGKYELQLWLLQDGKESTADPIAVYPVFVNHPKPVSETAIK